MNRNNIFSKAKLKHTIYISLRRIFLSYNRYIVPLVFTLIYRLFNRDTATITIIFFVLVCLAPLFLFVSVIKI